MIHATIGIPVYNEANYIRHTLGSALAQGASEIIVSDNGSTDGSTEICREFAQAHANVKLFTTPENKGARYNFMTCIDNATEDLFMWLGAHDLLPEGHLAHLHACFEQSDDVVLAYTDAVHFLDDGTVKSRYTFPDKRGLTSANGLDRLLTLAQHLTDGSMVYGLIRRDLALAAMKHEPHNPSDLFFLGSILLHGTFRHTPESMYVRRNPRPKENAKERIRRFKESCKLKIDVEDPSVFVRQHEFLAMAELLKELDISIVQKQQLKLAFAKKYLTAQHLSV